MLIHFEILNGSKPIQFVWIFCCDDPVFEYISYWGVPMQFLWSFNSFIIWEFIIHYD